MSKIVTVFHPEHPHYLLHKEYFAGCFASPDNLPTLQVRVDALSWKDIETATVHSWLELECFEYRIKPRTITRTVTYPEPMRAAPEVGAEVWLVICAAYAPVRQTWTNKCYHICVLKNGMCFSSKEDAQACYNELFCSDHL